MFSPPTCLDFSPIRLLLTYLPSFSNKFFFYLSSFSSSICSHRLLFFHLQIIRFHLSNYSSSICPIGPVHVFISSFLLQSIQLLFIQLPSFFLIYSFLRPSSQLFFYLCSFSSSMYSAFPVLSSIKLRLIYLPSSSPPPSIQLFIIQFPYSYFKDFGVVNINF